MSQPLLDMLSELNIPMVIIPSGFLSKKKKNPLQEALEARSMYKQAPQMKQIVPYPV